MPTPARYHGLRDAAVAAVDQQLAEPVWLSFLAGKGGPVDPVRPAREIEAVLRVGKRDVTNVAADMGPRSGRAGMAAALSRCSISRAAYPDLVVRAGDMLKATSRVGEPWFEVLDIADRGHARLVLILGEA